MNQLELKLETKRLLRLYEIAKSKVEYSYDGIKIVNPKQQGAATRIYSKAWNLYGDSYGIVELHSEVLNELKLNEE